MQTTISTIHRVYDGSGHVVLETDNYAEAEAKMLTVHHGWVRTFTLVHRDHS